MSWWNAKYTNNDGEYEITFASKEYEKAKAVEKVCCAVMDKAVKSPLDVEVVVRCKDCKYGYPCGDEIVCYHPEYELAEGKWSYKKDFFCAFGDTKEGADNV